MGELAELQKSETQLAEERMAAVERQVNQHVPKGIKRSIRCPYCGALNLQGKMLCCDLLRKALIAVLSARRALKMAEVAERHANN